MINFPDVYKIPYDEEKLKELLNRLKETNPEMFDEKGELKKEYRI